MSKKEIIFPGHGTPFNSKAREFERQEEQREKRIAKINNHHENSVEEKWKRAEKDKSYYIPFSTITGEKQILKAEDLAEGILPVNVFEVKEELVS
ncbi:MAG: hypothetical protein NT052_01310 [Candidatus Shapirobacteria bacterium]|nr:hypothetical protein [Candidatus Shapirobacteria bacterium]